MQGTLVYQNVGGSFSLLVLGFMNCKQQHIRHHPALGKVLLLVHSLMHLCEGYMGCEGLDMP